MYYNLFCYNNYVNFIDNFYHYYCKTIKYVYNIIIKTFIIVMLQ